MDDERDARDGPWFDQLYRDWHGAVLAYARRRTAEPDDLVAEVFAAAWRHRSRVPDPPLAWLLRTARNYSLHSARSIRRRDRLSARVWSATVRDQHQPDHADIVASRHSAASIILAAMNTLNRGDQEILRLSAWEELDTAQLAFVLEVSEVAARVRLHRAKRRLAAAVTQTETAEKRLPTIVEVRS